MGDFWPLITCPRESPTNIMSIPHESRYLLILASYAVTQESFFPPFIELNQFS